MVGWDGTFAGTERLPGWDVCRDGTFAGTGRLPVRGVCRDGTFAGTGRFSFLVYIRMYLIYPGRFHLRQFAKLADNLVPAKRIKIMDLLTSRVIMAELIKRFSHNVHVLTLYNNFSHKL